MEAAIGTVDSVYIQYRYKYILRYILSRVYLYKYIYASTIATLNCC